MIDVRELVDYQLMRNSTIVRHRVGEVSISQICDADKYLLSAARFHGELLTQPCGICHDNNLYQVLWCFGTNLKEISGSARSVSEVEKLSKRFNQFTVHEVEVCLNCRWNYLIRSFLVGKIPKSQKKISASNL